MVSPLVNYRWHKEISSAVTADSLIRQFPRFMFWTFPWTHNKSLVHLENSTHLSLAEPDTQERRSHTDQHLLWQEPPGDVYLTPTAPSGPHPSAPFKPMQNQSLLLHGRKDVARGCKKPTVMVDICHWGYHPRFPPHLSIPISKPLKADGVTTLLCQRVCEW